MNTIPILKDERHRKFCKLVLGGVKPAQAYQRAGYKAKTPQSRAAAASRLLKNVHIAEYLAAVGAEAQAVAAEEALLSTLETRTKYARIFRANILRIDPTNPDDPNADLIKKVKIREDIDANGKPRKLIEFEIHDAMAVARDDNKLRGDDPAANALQELATAFAKIGAGQGTLPSDRM